MTYRARDIPRFLLGALVAAAVTGCSLTPATAANSPAEVALDRWVVAVSVHDPDGIHKGPSWYWRDTFASKAECEVFKASPDWVEIYHEFAAHELEEHDGKVEISRPECVQRKDIQPYPAERGA